MPLTPLPAPSRDFVATREYFPQSWRTARRQRTRWVTGITLQGWERFGWRGTWSEIYWLWRDRKGLIGNPLGVLANVVFFYGVATGMWTRMTPVATELCLAAFAFQMLRLGLRMTLFRACMGWRIALGVPIRVCLTRIC